MREADFFEELHRLLSANVVGVSEENKIRLVQELCQIYQTFPENTPMLQCHFVPFIAGRRPSNEANHPGLGSSDNAGMILGNLQASPKNQVYLLYDLVGLDHFSKDQLKSLGIDCTISFAGTDASQINQPIPGWDRRPIEPAVMSLNNQGEIVQRKVKLGEAASQRLALTFDPNQELNPGCAWAWDQVDSQIRERAADHPDPFSFGELFSQMVHVFLRVTRQGIPIAATQTWVDVCDTHRFGSLYQRILDRLVTPDTQKQAQIIGLDTLDSSFHPWYPVLLIGSDKAALYTHALVEDIVNKELNLTDPRWLMRVGLYLEFLTCLGIFEAVKDHVGDLLTPAERAIFENSPTFAEIRRCLNPDGWRDVWELREIQFPKFGLPSAGPVSVLNLIQKKKATLAFLEVHHNDLKHALELAGGNVYSAQETWHRVFRDAERAVLRKTPFAFPELSFLNPGVNDFVLWHQKGRFDFAGINLLPKQFSAIFGDQDGLYASACNQYRASMNDVARWAKQGDIMDYTGDECVPIQVSLLQAYMNGQNDLLVQLQHRDGYAENLDSIVELPEDYIPSMQEIYTLLKEVRIFNLLSEDEIHQIARTTRGIHLGPMERIIIQGRPGSSLFLVGDGEMEVLVRQLDGTDIRVNVIKRGDIVGEMSLLTGAPRSATVRSINGGMVYEIGKEQYEPIIQSRPELIEKLTELMVQHIFINRQEHEAFQHRNNAPELRKRIKNFFLGAESAKS